ncbi:DUF2569 family protein [Brucella tritici]|uniref:DUF2569 family protein n=1 Tax=Brucella tritici TaxID=94626 RepID=UPI001591172E|nr:DUF2569 family protein [Brucella tritici]
MFTDLFKKEPIGIGGFFLIPIAALISSTIFISLDIFYTLNALDHEVIDKIYHNHKLLGSSIIFVLILQATLVILGAFSIYLMIKHDEKTKGCFIAFFIIKVAILNIATANLNELSYHFSLESSQPTGRSFITNSASLLLVPYLLLSRRVKNTFTRNQKTTRRKDRPI